VLTDNLFQSDKSPFDVCEARKSHAFAGLVNGRKCGKTHGILEKRPGSELSGHVLNKDAWPIKSDSSRLVKESFLSIL
jgi:hypothetical protein